MHAIYIGVILGSIVTGVLGGFSNFYYTVPGQPQQTAYFNTFSPPPRFTFTNPARAYAPPAAPTYYTTQHTFGFAPSSLGSELPTFTNHLGSGVPQQDEIFLTPQTQPIATPVQQYIPPEPAATVYSARPTPHFTGFAYHTEYNGGASSNVVFLTGPQAHQLRKLPFPSLVPQNGTKPQGRTVASDAIDSNAVTETVQGQSPIQQIDSADTAYQVIRTFLADHQPSFQNFYTTDTQYFGKSLDAYPSFPASTVPLAPIVPFPSIVSTAGLFDIPLDNDTENATVTESPKESQTIAVDSAQTQPNETTASVTETASTEFSVKQDVGDITTDFPSDILRETRSTTHAPTSVPENTTTQ